MGLAIFFMLQCWYEGYVRGGDVHLGNVLHPDRTQHVCVGVWTRDGPENTTSVAPGRHAGLSRHTARFVAGPVVIDQRKTGHWPITHAPVPSSVPRLTTRCQWIGCAGRRAPGTWSRSLMRKRPIDIERITVIHYFCDAGCCTNCTNCSSRKERFQIPHNFSH